MAKSRQSVLKRVRELKRMEKAAAKRQKKLERKQAAEGEFEEVDPLQAAKDDPDMIVIDGEVFHVDEAPAAPRDAGDTRDGGD